MATEIYPANDPFAPGWGFDCDVNMSTVVAFTATNRKIENRGNISEHVGEQPDQQTYTGLVTAMTVPPALPEAEKLANSKSRLKEVAKKRQPVLVQSGSDAAILTITRLEIFEGADLGLAFRATIQFTQLSTTTVGTTTVPAARLRRRVKRKAAPAKKGGSAKGSKPNERSKTMALKLAQGVSNIIF